MRLRVVVPGEGVVRGGVVRVGYVSLLGDADPEKGLVAGIPVAGKILVMEGVRGSTVGPYVLWGMARRGLGPKAIISRRIDLVLVTAAAMARVPLLQGDLPWDCAEVDTAAGLATPCREF